MALSVDHLVIAADTLDTGVRWCQEVLGVEPGPGGRHPLMGTHNRLLNIASLAHPGAYLEIIAIDPDAPPPGRPRWFGLDARPPGACPSLVHWVAKVEGVALLAQACRSLGLDPGQPVATHRDSPAGRLAWTLTLRDDGRPQAGGAMPSLIEWQGTLHPAKMLPPSGVELESLVTGGLPHGVAALLESPALGTGGDHALSVVLRTPRGPVTLHTGAPDPATSRSFSP
ncbi:MAG: VOC family protein [Rubrivivax sp.]|jgi:hypothetical protein